jgi:hypothetical protein
LFLRFVPSIIAASASPDEEEGDSTLVLSGSSRQLAFSISHEMMNDNESDDNADRGGAHSFT